MRIVICSADNESTAEIKKHLKTFSEYNRLEFEIFCFDSPLELIKSNAKYDIAFVDTSLNGASGIEISKFLQRNNRYIFIILVTDSPIYLDDAFEVNASRFFEKPLDTQRLYRALNDAVHRYENKSIGFYLKTGKAIEYVHKQDIIYVEIENRKTKFVTLNGMYYSAKPMKYWKSKLDDRCFGVPHNSYIVNMNYITYYSRSSITLNNEYEISIARTRAIDFSSSFYRLHNIQLSYN